VTQSSQTTYFALFGLVSSPSLRPETVFVKHPARFEEHAKRSEYSKAPPNVTHHILEFSCLNTTTRLIPSLINLIVPRKTLPKEAEDARRFSLYPPLFDKLPLPTTPSRLTQYRNPPKQIEDWEEISPGCSFLINSCLLHPSISREDARTSGQEFKSSWVPFFFFFSSSPPLSFPFTRTFAGWSLH